jgi:hypothetical protein
MDEVRKMAYIINENKFLREENNVMDSLISYNSKTIDLLFTNLELKTKEIMETRTMLNDCMRRDNIRIHEIEAIGVEHQKDTKKIRRRTIWQAGAGGLIIGSVLMLLIL